MVLALVEDERAKGKHYVIHRIVSIDDNRVILMGDGNLVLREHCDRGDVCAKVLQVLKPSGTRYSGLFQQPNGGKSLVCFATF